MTRMMVAEGPARIHDLLEFGCPSTATWRGSSCFRGKRAFRAAHRPAQGDMAESRSWRRSLPRCALPVDPGDRGLCGRGTGARGPVHLRRDRAAGCRPVEEPRFLPARAPSFFARAVSAISMAVTTNPWEACGQGVGMAHGRAPSLPIRVRPSFIPTAIDIGKDPAPLAPRRCAEMAPPL